MTENRTEPGAGSGRPDGTTDRVYFPELDGLRFVAFALVFFFHQGVPQPELSRMLGSAGALRLRENGWVGVQLFFILSGFLITTLLLREEAAFGRIDLKAFWFRRVLRIWPLYYLTVAITFLVLPWLDGSLATASGRAALGSRLPAFLTFLGNWSMLFQGMVASDAQSILWSVNVEEQFYLVVPLIVAWVPPRFRVPLVVALIGSAVGVRAGFARAGADHLWVYFNSFAQFDTLLSGVLLALCLGGDPRGGRAGRWLGWFQWPLYLTGAWVFSLSHLGYGPPWRQTWDFVAIWGAGMGLVAVAVTVPGGLRWALSNPRLVWLGKISYGLYMFHEIGFWLRNRFARRVGWFPNDQYLLSILGFALTVGLAAASYYLLERPFLRRKRAWTRVPSRPV